NIAALALAPAAAPTLQAQTIRQFTGHTAPVFSVAFSKDGKRLASASFDHTIKLWDVSSGKVSRTLTGHRTKVLTLAWRSDGRTLASGSVDGVVQLWDTATGQSK